MTLPARPLSRYVQPELTEARLARQWSAIDAERPHALRIPPWVSRAAVAFAIVVAAVIGRRWGAHNAATGAEHIVLEASATGGTIAVLPNGTLASLDPGSRLEVTALRADRMDLQLVRGSVELRVTHTSARAVHVRAGNVEVVDIGTTFRVELTSPSDVQVHVMEGSVELHRMDSTAAVIRALHGGESWTSQQAIGPAPRPSPAPTNSVPTPPAPVAAPETSEPLAAGPSRHAPPPVVTSMDSFEALMRANRATDAYVLLGPAGFARALETARPHEILELADAAKLSRHPQDAERAFDLLRRRFRSDPRAALAAYQLGRLRLEVLLDARGATDALSDAIALGPTSSFREDAESLRVEALDTLGEPAQCQEARDAYLSRYPHGIHIGSVSHLCRFR